MRFALIDRIIELEPGQRIMAIKSLSMAEEYLADHFPHFPVMPGVLMLESMVQAGAWLVRYTEDFAHSMVVLKEAVNVKFAHFLQPGQIMAVTAEVLKLGDRETKLKAQGTVDGRVIVSTRLTLRQSNLTDTQPWNAWTDQQIIGEQRKQLALLYPMPVEDSIVTAS
jgi:3-hydroxyacyl-[acyl-carrier-protein] dehydratase